MTYYNAPPFVISVAASLSNDRIRDFLDRELFPEFEPLWIAMDGAQCAPDGSSTQAYSSRMLGKLTVAVKAFIEKTREADAYDGPFISASDAAHPGTPHVKHT